LWPPGFKSHTRNGLSAEYVCHKKYQYMVSIICNIYNIFWPTLL
jgi:hypothetical protein